MRHFIVILPLLLAAAPTGAGAAPSSVGQDQLHADVTGLLKQLDSDRFDVRRRAAEKIEALVAKPELRKSLAAEFRRVLVQPDVSFEVRRQVERWSRLLPAPPNESAPDASLKELDDVMRRLDDDSYSARLGAARRLDWLLGNPKLVCPIMVRLKKRLLDESLDGEAKRRIETVWERARGTWLASDAPGDELPAVSDEQIDRWLDDLTRPAAPGGASGACRAHDAAECELLDLLARDEYEPRLKRALEARLAKKPDADAAAAINALLEWTKPELVAEYWVGRRQTGEQHLLVGVPTTSPGAVNPTCFDRIDDQVAHCTSGNSLSPGNYPVGEAYPHPHQPNAFFQLVNLSTPRRRMAYLSTANADPQKRLAALSRRTLDRRLAEQRILSESELVMLGQLDPAEVSRFAGKYFLLLDDGALPQAGSRHLGGRPSRFGMICALLAVDGTKDAMPGLAEAIAKSRFRPPTLLAPFRLDLLAALSIATRDPWPDVDGWLADRVGESEPLMDGQSGAAEIGGTAAAILLKRHGQSPTAFGLQPIADALMNHLHVDGYRCISSDARAKVQRWWQQEKTAKRS